jgi:DNA/RNA endonuclease YhcR with UshA esterase domain
MKVRFLLAIIIFLLFICGNIASASSFLILEVQTTGSGGASDECVKIKNNTGAAVNLEGYKLQSHSKDFDLNKENLGDKSTWKWTNRTSDGLSEEICSYIEIGSNEIFIIAPSTYNGTDWVCQHTAKWGLSDEGGGVRFLNKDGNVLAEKYWGTLEYLNSSEPAPAPGTPPPTENPPAVEPVEPADSVSTDDADDTAVPQATETPTPDVIPSEERVEESQAQQESGEIQSSEIQPPLTPPISQSETGGDRGGVKTAKAGEETAVISNPAPATEHNSSIVAAKKLKNDSKVKVRGVVSVLPGVLGSQIFYLSGSGIQIYMNKKDFPDLKVGDTVDIEGTLSEAYGEKRIKLASKDSIKLVSNGTPPAPQEIAANEIGESMEGSLVKINGEIIEVKKDYWYLADGEKEIKILLKEGANIPADLVKAGDKVEIVGIVSQYNKEYRLLPRNVNDIKILESKDSAKSVTATSQEQKSKGFGVKDYLFVGIPSLLLAGFLAVRRKVMKNKEIPKQNEFVAGQAQEQKNPEGKQSSDGADKET